MDVEFAPTRVLFPSDARRATFLTPIAWGALDLNGLHSSPLGLVNHRLVNRVALARLERFAPPRIVQSLSGAIDEIDLAAIFRYIALRSRGVIRAVELRDLAQQPEP